MDQLRLFKSRRFCPLFIAQFCSTFNDNAFKNAVFIWLIYSTAAKLNLNAHLMVTFAAALFILPFFLFSALAGQMADKYERSRLARTLKTVEIFLVLLIPLCFYIESVAGLLIILFALGSQATFFSPIKYSLLPQHLHSTELLAGNGLLEGGTFLAILFGTIFGGVIITINLGMWWLSSCLIVLSFIGYASSFYIPQAHGADKFLRLSWNIPKETIKIIRYAWQEHTVGLSIIAIAWFWLFGMMLITQLPAYTKQIVLSNEHVVTLFLTVFSIGIGTGSMLCNYLLKSKIDGRFVPWGCLGMSVFMIDFYFASLAYTKEAAGHDQLFGVIQFLTSSMQSWRIVFDLLLTAILAGIYTVPLYAIMQHRSDKRYLARIIAANNIIDSLFMIIGSGFAFGMLFFGYQTMDILLALSLANLLVFFVVGRIVKKRLRNA